MTVTRIFHEGGLCARSTSESKHIVDNYGLRPVLVTEACATGDRDHLLSKCGVLLGIQASALYSDSTNNGVPMFKTFAIAYDVGAALHHCENLTKAYGSIVAKYQRIQSIPGIEASESDLANFSYQAEPYYELDALLSASRRVYNKIAYFVWQAFEGGGGGMPDNMGDLIGRLKACPEPLATRLRSSWINIGEKLKDYRDCTQHFASMDNGLTTVTMKRIEDGVWMTWARIPDNPEVKSKKKFTYAANHDALTYGWEVANEVISLASEAVALASASGKKNNRVRVRISV